MLHIHALESEFKMLNTELKKQRKIPGSPIVKHFTEVFEVVSIQHTGKELGPNTIITFMLHFPFKTDIQISAQATRRGLQNRMRKKRQFALFSNSNNARRLEAKIATRSRICMWYI